MHKFNGRWIDLLWPRQNGRQGRQFQMHLFNEDVWISLRISLKFVSNGPINNILAMVLVMAPCLPGNRPLSEPVMVSLLTYICATRLQRDKTLPVLNHAWVNASYINYYYDYESMYSKISQNDSQLKLWIFPKFILCMFFSNIWCITCDNFVII